MWKKRKDIEGVSGSSVVGLKAIVEEEQRHSKKFKPNSSTTSHGINLKTPKPTQSLSQKTKDLLNGTNSGIAQRQARDEASQMTQEETRTLEVSEQKLRSKAELYNKMVRGEVQLPGDNDDNSLIDFEKKNWDVLNNPSKKDSFYSNTDSIEQERLKWEKESQQEIENEDLKLNRIRMAQQMERETEEGRSKTSKLKTDRKLAMQRRLEQIQQKSKKQTQTQVELYDPEEEEEEEKTQTQTQQKDLLNDLDNLLEEAKQKSYSNHYKQQ